MDLREARLCRVPSLLSPMLRCLSSHIHKKSSQVRPVILEKTFLLKQINKQKPKTKQEKPQQNQKNPENTGKKPKLWATLIRWGGLFL